jgi:hypothetical protein
MFSKQPNKVVYTSYTLNPKFYYEKDLPRIIHHDQNLQSHYKVSPILLKSEPSDVYIMIKWFTAPRAPWV